MFHRPRQALAALVREQIIFRVYHGWSATLRGRADALLPLYRLARRAGRVAADIDRGGAASSV